MTSADSKGALVLASSAKKPAAVLFQGSFFNDRRRLDKNGSNGLNFKDEEDSIGSLEFNCEVDDMSQEARDEERSIVSVSLSSISCKSRPTQN